jgi:hypothetical protein
MTKYISDTQKMAGVGHMNATATTFDNMVYGGLSFVWVFLLAKSGILVILIIV